MHDLKRGDLQTLEYPSWSSQVQYSHDAVFDYLTRAQGCKEPARCHLLIGGKARLSPVQ